MPAVFKSPGVKDGTKTSVHVLLGKGTPFGEDRTPRIRDFVDGTSNTVLAVLAGGGHQQRTLRGGQVSDTCEHFVASTHQASNPVLVRRRAGPRGSPDWWLSRCATGLPVPAG